VRTHLLLLVEGLSVPGAAVQVGPAQLAPVHPHHGRLAPQYTTQDKTAKRKNPTHQEGWGDFSERAFVSPPVVA
jgi:hypothetical protein